MLTASLTVEAAIVLPLFVFMMYILIFPLKVMEAERKLQNSMESTAKQMASIEYAAGVAENSINPESNYREMIGGLADGIEEGISYAAVLLSADTDILEDIFFSEDTAVFSDDGEADPDMIYMELKYRLKLPFEIFEIRHPQKSLVTSRRAWTGSDGGRGRSEYGDDTGDDGGESDFEDDGRTVYLGKTSTVYHEDPNCHYLSNVMHTASSESVSSLRNESGGKYHACPTCSPGNTGTVYYFENGTAYHSSPDCKAVTAYSRAVPLSEVSGMRACSYCGKTHAE